jgi:hypothetical protein
MHFGNAVSHNPHLAASINYEALRDSVNLAIMSDTDSESGGDEPVAPRSQLDKPPSLTSFTAQHVHSASSTGGVISSFSFTTSSVAQPSTAGSQLLSPRGKPPRLGKEGANLARPAVDFRDDVESTGVSDSSSATATATATAHPTAMDTAEATGYGESSIDMITSPQHLEVPTATRESSSPGPPAKRGPGMSNTLLSTLPVANAPALVSEHSVSRMYCPSPAFLLRKLIHAKMTSVQSNTNLLMMHSRRYGRIINGAAKKGAARGHQTGERSRAEWPHHQPQDSGRRR